MPGANYLRVVIGDKQIEVTDPRQLPISIDYTLEDPQNFQQKKSSESFNVEVPATLMNDLSANTYRNPDVQDLTDGGVFDTKQPAVIEANGYELLVGKAALTDATHDIAPISYTFDFWGDNADWIIDMQDKTLYDFLKHITISFTKGTIVNSWQFDGRNEALPYVFAPVRYRFPPGDYTIDTDTNTSIAVNDNYLPTYMRPAISKYWVLYWAFKSLGYRISSTFFDTTYFRRQVMPWTWGNFLDSDGTRLEAHRFLAKSSEDCYFEAGRGQAGEIDGFVDLKVTNDFKNGAFDNNDDYSYDVVNKQMSWEYRANQNFGVLDATFSLQIYYQAALSGGASYIYMNVYWYVNNVFVSQEQMLRADSPLVGTGRPAGNPTAFFTHTVNPGDVVSAKVFLHVYRDKTAINDVSHINLNVIGFQLDYFRIPLGGTVDFLNFTGFQKYKILDYIAGVIDEFDLSINTDSVNKIVVIEPTHPYSLSNNLGPSLPGYFKNDFIDWNSKEDLSKKWKMDKFKDSEQQVTWKYKDDPNDGILKLVQDRNICKLTAAKYVFPDRFNAGSKDRENRFFSPTMHYDVDDWKSLGTGNNQNISAQIVCIIPENISNTSQSASDNTFNPKSCYYKGFVNGYGAWQFDGEVLQDYPFMFAVNYKPAGHNDPILSYCDEKIAYGPTYLATEDGVFITTEDGLFIEIEGGEHGDFVLGKGLLKRFFWQRLAIMRNGQWYLTWFRVKNIDVAGQLHREFKSYRGHRWELIQIKGYKPLIEDSTQCLLYKWVPVTQVDADNTYPSEEYILNGTTPPDSDSTDIKYFPLKCLFTDIPTT